MQFFSTKRESPPVSFRQAVLNGQPPDGGLYFPSHVPPLPENFWSGFKKMSQAEIACEVIRQFVDEDMPPERLFEICAETIDFEFPLVQIGDGIYSLELFHGPTLSFKDVGARFLARCLQSFTDDSTLRKIVLVATSGDTGGAVAAAFAETSGIDVVILFPMEGVSRFQERQLTTAGRNVHAVEVAGNFDDCQRLVKTAFADVALNDKADLISANSINVARWLSQQFYYFFALHQWEHADPPVICVPPGNFGNVSAGLLAAQRGLPCSGFIAATNANDTVPRYFATGDCHPKETVRTLSNAMDVADPSNLPRLMELFGNDLDRARAKVEAIGVSDDETWETIADVCKSTGYLLDPHGAVGYAALRTHLEAHPGARGIFLETAHPSKFDSIKEIVGQIDSPTVNTERFRPERKICAENNYEELRLILTRIAAQPSED